MSNKREYPVQMCEESRPIIYTFSLVHVAAISITFLLQTLHLNSHGSMVQKVYTY
jgi:hypothetical protein